jgi:hypothetical protein
MAAKDFLSGVAESLGGNGRITSAYRSQEEQDALVARGVTQAKRSRHTTGTREAPGAVDIGGYKGNVDDLAASLTRAGYPVAKIRPETGHGKNQGTGPHMHVEFGPSGAGKAMTRVDPGASSVALPAPTVKPGSNMDPFAMESKVGQAHQAVMADGEKVVSATADAAAQLDSLQESREADLRKAVETKDTILTGIGEATEELKARVQPLFERKAALAHRRVEIQDMNPIKRAFLGIFNRNYDEGHVDAVERAVDSELQAVGAEYESTSKLQNTLIGVVEGKYQGANAISSLEMDNISQDLTIMNQHWSGLRQQFSDAVAGVSAGSQLTQAQMLQRNDTLTQMDMGHINSAMAEAKRGGFATVNGVQISLAELTERQNQIEGQENALESQRLALTNQKQNLADQAAARLVSHMSPTEVNQAIAAGGVWKGVQLDQGQLTGALQNHMQRSQLLAGGAMDNVSRETYTGAMDGYTNVIRSGAARIQQISGANVPDQYKAFVGTMVGASRQFQDAINRAPTEEAKAAIRAQALKTFQGFEQKQSEVIDKIAQGMSRNPDVQVVLGGFMKGNPPTGEQATRGLIGLVSGGSLPPGMRLSGPAAAAVQAARGAVESVYSQNGGKENVMAMMQGNGGKESKEAMQRKLMSAVTARVGKAWQNGNMNELINGIPALAMKSGHPFGAVSPEDFRAARAAGDQAGIQKFAANLGWTPEQAQSVFGNGGTKAAGAQKLGMDAESYQQALGKINALQNTEFLRALDSSPSAERMKVRPSSALVEFMKGDTYQGAVGFFNRNVGRTGMGEMLADSISGGALGQTAFQYANQLHAAQSAIVADDQQTTRQQATMYKGDPLRRTATILGAIPDLNQHQETVLMAAIRREVVEPAYSSAPLGNSGGVGQGISNRIDDFITTGKFEDPKLEKLRQVAARHWKPYSESTDTAISRFFDHIWSK